MKDYLFIFRGQVFDKEIYPKLELYKNHNIVLVVEDKIRKNIIHSLVSDLSLNIKLLTMNDYVGGIVNNMKFSNNIINPPYAIQVGPDKTKQIWGEVVEKALLQLYKGGNQEAWHPGGWRNISGDYRYIFKLYISRNVTDIEINDITKGMEVFGAKTPFDRVLLTNEPYKGETNIIFTDGTQKTMDISKMDFIPNFMVDEVMDLVAKPGEEKVEVLYNRSMYGSDKKHMSHEKSSNFKYPCVYSILSDGSYNLMYSSIKKDYLGIPKVVCGNGANPTSMIDKKGQYGLTQYAFGIVNDVDNLPLIEKALHSEEFQKINQATKFVATQGNPLVYPRILSSFKKDFWKKFV